MKVLWFTNTPCSAAEKFGKSINAGGWLNSLEKEISKLPEIELAISFYSYETFEPFIHNGTQFYPVLRKGQASKFSRLLKRVFNNRNNDNREIKELLKVINLCKPDIIHVHGTEDNFGLIQYYTNLPVVISIQGLLNPIVEKYFSGIPESVALKYEGVIVKLLASGIKHNFKLFKKSAQRELRILSAAKYIIGRTNWDKRITRVLAPNSQYFIGNEILRPAFYSKKWNKSEFGCPLQIVTTMSDALYKGFETIVNTAEILNRNMNLKFVWKIIGLNEKSCTVKIVKKWKKVNLKNLKVELLGFKNDKEIVEILLDSDIYCQVSHIENSPNGLCEAMILGMPLIASNVGGTSSLFPDKEKVGLVQDGDPFSFAELIQELSTSIDNAKQLIDLRNEKVNNRSNINKVTSEYAHNYYLIISASKNN